LSIYRSVDYRIITSSNHHIIFL